MPYNKKQLKEKRALVVEDHPAYSEYTTAALQSLGVEVHPTFSVLGTLTVVANLKQPFDLAMVDIYLPLEDGGIDRQNMGIYLSAILKSVSLDLPIIAISNYVEEIPSSFNYLFADVLKKRDVFMHRNGAQTLIDSVYSTLTNSSHS